MNSENQAYKAVATSVTRGYESATRCSRFRVLTPGGCVAALYWSLLADGRMVVVLDNAADADQVHLLPADTHGCTTIVTSRSQLAGLTGREGAARLDLMVLPDEAIALLLIAAGPQHIDADADRLLSWFAHTATNAAVHLPSRCLARLAAPPTHVVPRTFHDRESALQ